MKLVKKDRQIIEVYYKDLEHYINYIYNIDYDLQKDYGYLHNHTTVEFNLNDKWRHKYLNDPIEIRELEEQLTKFKNKEMEENAMLLNAIVVDMWLNGHITDGEYVIQVRW